MSNHTDKLKRLADECRREAEIISNRPGLVGFGAKEGPIIDLYQRMGAALDEVAASVSRPLHNTQGE